MVTPKSPWSNKLAPKTIPNPAKNTTFPETNTTPGNSWKMKCRDSLCSGAMLVLGRVIGGFNHPIEQYSRQLGTPQYRGWRQILETTYIRSPFEFLFMLIFWGASTPFLALECSMMVGANIIRLTFSWCINQPWRLVQLFFGEAAHICLHQSEKSPLNKPPTPKVQDNTIVLDNLWHPFLWSYGPIKEGSVIPSWEDAHIYLMRKHLGPFGPCGESGPMRLLPSYHGCPYVGGGSTWTTPFHKGAMFFLKPWVNNKKSQLTEKVTPSTQFTENDSFILVVRSWNSKTMVRKVDSG